MKIEAEGGEGSGDEDLESSDLSDHASQSRKGAKYISPGDHTRLTLSSCFPLLFVLFVIPTRFRNRLFEVKHFTQQLHKFYSVEKKWRSTKVKRKEGKEC